MGTAIAANMAEAAMIEVFMIRLHLVEVGVAHLGPRPPPPGAWVAIVSMPWRQFRTQARPTEMPCLHHFDSERAWSSQICREMARYLAVNGAKRRSRSREPGVPS